MNKSERETHRQNALAEYKTQTSDLTEQVEQVRFLVAEIRCVGCIFFENYSFKECQRCCRNPNLRDLLLKDLFHSCENFPSPPLLSL